MGISAKYDRFEDRMKLLVEIGNNTLRPFWFKRFQWINLIFAIGLLSKTKANITSNSLQKGHPKKDSIKKSLELSPFFVKDVQVKTFKKKSKLIIFPLEASPVFLSIDNDDLRLLNDMLIELAEKAGWDPLAAIDRVNVEQKSRLVIRDIMKR